MAQPPAYGVPPALPSHANAPQQHTSAYLSRQFQTVLTERISTDRDRGWLMQDIRLRLYGPEASSWHPTFVLEGGGIWANGDFLPATNREQHLLAPQFGGHRVLPMDVLRDGRVAVDLSHVFECSGVILFQCGGEWKLLGLVGISLGSHIFKRADGLKYSGMAVGFYVEH